MNSEFPKAKDDFRGKSESLVVGYECVEAGSRNPCSGEVVKSTFEANGDMKPLKVLPTNISCAKRSEKVN